MKIALAALSLGLLALAPRAAMANRNHGVLCTIAPANNQVAYGQLGIFNTSLASAATVHCGGGKEQSAAGLSSVKIIVHDRHPTQNVCCIVQLTGGGGTLFSSTQVCSTVSPSPIQELTTPMLDRPGFVHIACTLPPATTGPGGGTSHVSSYTITP